MTHEGDNPTNPEIPTNIQDLDMAITHLFQHDHSVEYLQHPDEPTPEEHLQVIDTTIQLLTIIKPTIPDPEISALARKAIEKFQFAQQGYEYRAANKLPGLAQQFKAIRAAMVSGSDYEAQLTTLSQQPDATEIIKQLHREQEVYEEVLDRGGELDIDSLQERVWQMFSGLKVIPSWELEARLRLIDDLSSNISGAEPLAEVQGRQELIHELHDTLAKVKTMGLLEMATSLESSLDRLLLERKIDIPEDLRRAHYSALPEYDDKMDPVGKFREILHWLASSVGLNPATIMINGIDKETMLLEQLSLQQRIDNLRLQEGVETIWDALPIVNIIRAKKRSGITDELRKLIEHNRLLQNRLTLTDDLNKTRDYLFSLEQPLPPEESVN